MYDDNIVEKILTKPLYKNANNSILAINRHTYGLLSLAKFKC
jgi:hypothetical protein